jgi:hypothetical protein
MVCGHKEPHPLRDAPASSNIFTQLFPMHMHACHYKQASCGPWCLSGAFDWETVVTPHTRSRANQLHNTHTPHPTHSDATCQRKSPRIYECTFDRSGPPQASVHQKHPPTHMTHPHTLVPCTAPPSKRGAMCDMQLYALQPTEAAVANNNSNRFGCTTIGCSIAAGPWPC